MQCEEELCNSPHVTRRNTANPYGGVAEVLATALALAGVERRIIWNKRPARQGVGVKPCQEEWDLTRHAVRLSDRCGERHR